MSSSLEEIIEEIKEEAVNIKEKIEKNDSLSIAEPSDRQKILNFLNDLISHELENIESLRKTIQSVKRYFCPDNINVVDQYAIFENLWNLFIERNMVDLIPHITRGIITHSTAITHVGSDELTLLSSFLAAIVPKTLKNKTFSLSEKTLEYRFPRFKNNKRKYAEFAKKIGLTLKFEEDQAVFILSDKLEQIINNSAISSRESFPTQIFDVMLYSYWLSNFQNSEDDHFINILCNLIALFVIFGLAMANNDGSNGNLSSHTYLEYLLEPKLLDRLLLSFARLVAYEFGPKFVNKIYDPKKPKASRIRNVTLIFREISITVVKGQIRVETQNPILQEVIKSRVRVDTDT